MRYALVPLLLVELLLVAAYLASHAWSLDRHVEAFREVARERMSIVKEIMDIHGGRVRIVSRPGGGTTVTLWLPRADSRG